MRKSCSVALSHATSCAHRRDDSYRLRPLHRRPIPPSPLLPPTALLLVSTPASCANLSLHLLSQARCPIRGSRQPFLSSFGIHLCIAEPLYPQRLPRWLPRRCREHCFFSFRPRTFPPCRLRNPFPLPKSHLDRSLYRFDLVQVSSYHFLCYPPRWSP